MPPPDEYRRNAVECARLAKLLTEPAHKLAMLDIAQAWARLAKQAIKNSQTDIVYEVLGPRRTDRPEAGD
jgi:hypothetical protein